MHVYTLVLTVGPRRSAINRAEDLLARSLPNWFDWWETGGRFWDRLGRTAHPEIEAWYAEERQRRMRWDQERDLDADEADCSYDLGELAWDSAENAYRKQLRNLEHAAGPPDWVRLTRELPAPLSDSMIPAALITPNARWRLNPADWDGLDPRWCRWVNATIDQHRGNHCAVVADCHC